jgi:hypothetical protein
LGSQCFSFIEGKLEHVWLLPSGGLKSPAPASFGRHKSELYGRRAPAGFVCERGFMYQRSIHNKFELVVVCLVKYISKKNPNLSLAGDEFAILNP